MRILLHYRHFPVAIGRYIHWGLESLGHSVISVGPYSKGAIPWGQEFYYREYEIPPTIETPDTERYNIQDVWNALPQKPDIVIQAADVSWLEGDPPVKNVIIATDPHCIDYHPRLAHADEFVSMQNVYLDNYRRGIWMPYAYDENIHKKLNKKILFDVVMVGLQYEHRVCVVEKMTQANLRVFSTLGLIYDDYVRAYNSGKIALSYSSKKDLPARFWEGLAMGRMVLQNYVPDLENLPFKEGEHYVGFSTIDEAVEKAVYYSSHENKREHIAQKGYEAVRGHTYAMRMKKLLATICE